MIYHRGAYENVPVQRWVVVILALQWILLLAVYFLEIGIFSKDAQTRALQSDNFVMNWNTIRVCGYNKALITFLKYSPQVYHNYKRKSTKGWSLANIFMDFSGGLLSFAQIIVDSQARNKPVFGKGTATGFDVIKFALSIITMIFDLIFLV